MKKLPMFHLKAKSYITIQTQAWKCWPPLPSPAHPTTVDDREDGQEGHRFRMQIFFASTSDSQKKETDETQETGTLCLES